MVSKAELARRMGVSSGYVYLLETGRSAPPSLEKVEKLAHCLQLSPGETDELVVAAAAGRTGAAEASVLRQTGPSQARGTTARDLAEPTATPQMAGTWQDCVVVPVTEDNMAPVLCRGQQAICSRTQKPGVGDIVMVRIAEGAPRFGQCVPLGDTNEVLLLEPTSTDASATVRVQTDQIREMLVVVGLLFRHAEVA